MRHRSDVRGKYQITSYEQRHEMSKIIAGERNIKRMTLVSWQ